MPPTAPPVALTIAGSDNSAGAGIQADLKTFSAHGVYGLTALTCVVAEIPGNVKAVEPVGLDVIREQIAMSFATFPVGALKTGLLHSRAIVEAVCDALSAGPRPARFRLPLVVDPVMVATSGKRLLDADAIDLYRRRLIPAAHLITPNVDEARTLLDVDVAIGDHAQLRAAGRALAAHYGQNFLMKGGHLGGCEALDVLCMADGDEHEFRAPYTGGVATHGTGCTYSAAITAGLAQGLHLVPAIEQAKRYITASIGQFFRWRHDNATTDALCHWPDLSSST